MSTEDLRTSYQLAISLLFRAWEYAKDRFDRESVKRKKCDEVLPHVQSIISNYVTVFGQSAFPIQKARQLVKLLQEAAW